MRAWDTLRGEPTWDAGSQALKVWLGSNFPSLRETGSVIFSSQSVVERPITRSHILVDLAVADQFREWSSKESSISETTDPTPLIESILAPASEFNAINPPLRGLSVLGIQATKKGVLSCNPQVPEQYAPGGEKIPFVIDTELNKTKRSNIPRPRWEIVASQDASITGFHIDSHGSGHYVYQVFGTKVICVCPCTDKNWEIIKPYYMQVTPLNKCLSYLLSLTARLAELTQKFEFVTVDILNPGDWIFIPPGYIHAVITPMRSSLINISLFRSDWIEVAGIGLRRERVFCNDKDSDILKLIIGRRARDLEMYRNLSRKKELELNLELKKLIEDETIMIEEIKKLRQKADRLKRKKNKLKKIGDGRRGMKRRKSKR